MIDIHSHLIPSIDDGAKDEKMTLAMLKRAEKSGTKKIILTPHYFRGRFMTPLNEVKEKLTYIRRLCREEDLSIRVYAGQEIYYTKSLLEDLEDGVIGTLNDSRYMLIEFNMSEIDSDALDTMYELRVKGIVPVIAHPERYKEFQEKPSRINKFIEEGCLFQFNANSIDGLLGKSTKKTAEVFLENGIYSFIGSDAHSDDRRNTDISVYVDKIEKINKGFMRKAEDNGQAILDNEIVRFKGKKIIEKKKGIFSFFGR